MSDPARTGPRDYRIETLVLPVRLRDQLAAHAESAYPDEACGVMLGKFFGSEVPVVTRAVPVRNSGPWTGEGYRIRADELYELTSAHDSRGERLVGTYHSHPDRTARPSDRDLQNAVPGLLYLCVSVRAGRAGSRITWVAPPDGPGPNRRHSQEGVCPN